MTVYLNAKDVSIDIPIYTTERSFRGALVSKYIGGSITTDHNRIKVHALRNVNFQLQAGDRLALIGHNGSGKSTLLNTLAGIYHPMAGKVESRGHIIPLLQYSPGMDDVDTGIENIYTVGLFFGRTKKEIESKIPDIVEFTGLQDFINLPVRTYSNGMRMRLNFGIAVCLTPDILLIDEAIGTGDEAFAERAREFLVDYANKIKIMVLASHSRDLVKRLCNKAILLDHGNMIAFGGVDEIYDMYDRKVQESATV